MKLKPKRRGNPLLRAAWNFIAEHPEQWDQTNPSGQPCCIGNHARRIARNIRLDAYDALRRLCQCKSNDALYLWTPNRTMPELRARVAKLCGAKGLRPVPKGFQ